MQVTGTQPRQRGAAFFPIVISSIGTAAGLLLLLTSVAVGPGDGEPMPGMFTGIRWLAAGLTLLSGTLLALSLGQLAGRRSLMDGKAATILALLAALGLIALLVRTMVI
jgi:hypothetical protein